MIRVAIIGATGYTALDAINILLRHEQTQVTYLTALAQECGPLTDVFPALQGRLDVPIEPIDLDKLAKKADVALCCLPHRASMGFVPKLLDAGLKVVDFSADYRMHDVAVYEAVYGVEHTDKDNIPRAVFGLPELFRDKVVGAQLVANPGCYPTAAALAVAPLLREGLIASEDIIVNAVSGSTGAGRKAALAFHFPEMNENLFAYAVGTHRHQPEIEQILGDFSQAPANVLFQPHVACYDRGIAETIYCRPTQETTPERLADLYADFYKDEPFVRCLTRPPRVKDIAGSNFCDLYATTARGKIVVFATIDNLIKGASGQAVQNMNIICDLPETMGLL